jgi:hypothetical protein
MIQTLALLALIFTLGAAVLTSGVLSARAALDRFVAQETALALRDALASYVTDIRTIVAAQGASGPWPSSQQDDPYAHAAANPQALCSSGPAGAACPFRYALAWTIDGHSNANANANGGPGVGGAAVASNVQRSVIDEERVAGSVTVRILDRTGNVVAERTRSVTLRVFDAEPYAVVAGVREWTVLEGTRAAAQGDDGGTPPRDGTAELADELAPDPAHPDRYRDTRIKVDMDCAEQSAHFDEGDAFADNDPSGDDGLPWGVSGHAFEAPCAPTYAQHITLNAPGGSAYPSNPFPINAFAQANWTTGDENGSAWSP